MPNDEPSQNRATSPQSSGDEGVIREPENSTVDNWLGQRVARDEERVDEVLEQTGGDEAEAQRRFERASGEGDEYRSEHEQGRS